MKKTPYLVLLTLSLLVTECLTIPEAKASDLEIRAMTFNIRNGRAKDGENRWKLRKDFV
jgi:starvation-inducible outer membrane lipoprotein